MSDDINYHNFLQVLDEAKPYQDSIIWDFSNSYYQNKGITAWSETSSKPVPHKVGTNFQNAFKLAFILKEHIQDKKVRVLECGAGSGKFARNFLFALKDLGIINQVFFVISDYSKKNLDEIKTSGLLEPFVENVHFELKHLDITDSNHLEDSSYEFIYMHYVLDALKFPIIKKIDGEFNELNIKTLLRENHEADVFKNPFLLARLEFEDSYKELVSSFDSKILGFYKSYYSQINDSDDLVFLDSALSSLEILLKKLTDSGFLLSVDIDIGGDKRFLAVGNSLAHPIDSALVLEYFSHYNSFALKDKSLTRMVLSKAETKILKSYFADLFEKDDSINELIQLEKELESKLDRAKLEKLSMLSPYNAKTYFLWSKFFKENQDYKQARLLEEKATSMNFWSDF